MSKTRDTDPDAPNFTSNNECNKPDFAYKGGNSPDSAVLAGLIEPHVDDSWFGSSVEDFEVFLTKRQIGGKKVNDERKIAGWKEVPTVLDWNSTYRHSEWLKNFQVLYEKLNEDGISSVIKSGDLNGKEKAHNHAVAVFLNSFFAKETRYTSYNNMPEVEQLLDYLTLDVDVVQRHAQDIYLNDQYKGRDDHKVQKIEIDGEMQPVKYNEFKISTYEQIVDLWFDYIDMMEEMKVYQVNMSGEESLTLDPEHRWKQRYTNKMFAKFKDLERSRFTDMWKTMISLTTYQDKIDGKPETPEDWDKERGSSWFESMERLKDSLYKLLDVLRTVANRELETDFHYIWIVEAHETGYPHLHLAVFGDVSEWLDTYKNQLRVREILEEKHDLGKSGVATDFETKPPSGDGTIDKLSSYLMKYFQKNFGEFKEDYEDKDLSDKDWGTLVFNACMFTAGFRTWGTSRDVGSVMKTNRNESDKEYNNLGGELTAETDKSFRQLVVGKGDEQLKTRLNKRDRFRKAIKERKNL